MRFLRPTAFIAAALMSASAQAVMVTSWDFITTSAFVNPATFTAGPGVNIDTPTLLAWGVPATALGQSSLAISGNPASSPPPVDTNNLTPTPGQTFTHTNHYLVSGSSHLDEVNVLTTIDLTPSGGGPNFHGEAVFLVNFEETSNSGTCLQPNIGPPCADIFVISGNLDAFSFAYDGYLYSVSIIPPSNLGGLTAAQCAAAGATAPCVGFLTAENAVTDAQFGFIITAREITVPEPGTLALLGLALFGIAWTTRRRRS